MNRVSVIVLIVLAMVSQVVVAGGKNPYLKKAARRAELVLKSPVTVPPNEVKVYLQKGRAMPYMDLDLHETYCFLELKKITKEAYQIEPTVFVVRRRLISEEETGSTTVDYSTELKIRSPEQPNVFRMACLRIDDTSYGTHVRLKEFQKAVGPYLELRPRARK